MHPYFLPSLPPPHCLFPLPPSTCFSKRAAVRLCGGTAGRQARGHARSHDAGTNSRFLCIVAAEDFANFLAHPLISKAAEAHWSQTPGGGFVFKSRGEGEGSGWHRNAAHIEAGRGCVLFAGSYRGASTRLALFPLQKGVTVKPVGQVGRQR